eukprot:2643720-Pleurochrysis_carterae.AAC.2
MAAWRGCRYLVRLDVRVQTRVIISALTSPAPSRLCIFGFDITFTHAASIFLVLTSFLVLRAWTSTRPKVRALAHGRAQTWACMHACVPLVV